MGRRARARLDYIRMRLNMKRVEKYQRKARKRALTTGVKSDKV